MTTYSRTIVHESDNKTTNLSVYMGREPCTVVQYGSQAQDTGTISKSIGQTLANFSSRKRNGELLPFTPWTKMEITSTLTGAHNSYTTSGSCQCSPCREYWNTGSGIWCHSSVPTGLGMDYQNLLSEAGSHLGQGVSMNEALASIYDKGWDALTFLAEAKSTFRMFGNIVRTFTSFARLCEKTDPRNWDKLWLEWRYGWRTLAFDIDTFTKAMRRSSDLSRFKGSSKASSSSDLTTTTNHSGVNWDGRTIVTDHITWSPKISVILDVHLPRIWFNPIVTGYEVIPYSFVFDWIINTGDYLKALALISLQTDGVAATGVQLTWTRTWDHKVTSWRDYGGFSWGGVYESVRTTTGKITYRLPSAINVSPPQFHLNLNVNRIIDAVALLKGIFLR